MAKLAEQLKQGADQAWESLSEGWRELSARASGALTRFRPAPVANSSTVRTAAPLPFGGWAFMAADVFDDEDKVIVRIEAPGMHRDDFTVELNDAVLTVWATSSSSGKAVRGATASCNAPTEASAAT